MNGFPFAAVIRSISLALLLLSLVPAPAHAQRDAALEAMLKTSNEERPTADPSPVPKSSVSLVNLRVHWGLWKRVAAEGQSGKDELEALEHDGRSLGHVNQVVQALAVSAVAMQQKDVLVGKEMFEGARMLAPDLPYVEFAASNYILDRDITSVRYWAVPLIQGFKKAWFWPDTRFTWALKGLLLVLAAFGLATFAFIIGQTIRHFGIVSYDLARSLPRGFSSNQTVVLLMTAVVAPTIIFRSLFLGAIVLLVILSFAQNLRERFISALVFAGCVVLPLADKQAFDLASFAGGTTQALIRAQYEHCDAGCIEDLEMRHSAAPADELLLYTRLLAGYRTGETAEHRRIVESVSSTPWSPEIAPYAYNLSGASQIALGGAKQAVEDLNRARSGLLHSAAPSFNLMRAYQIMDESEQSSAAFREAAARNLDSVSQFMRFTRRDVNSYLMAPPLPLELFWKHHLTSSRNEVSVITPWWNAIAGPKIGLEASTLAGGVGFLFVLLGGVLRRSVPMSTPCPRCGLARDPSDDQTTGAHAYCLPCYRTFVTGAGLDYNARIYNETVLGRRDKMNGFLRRVLCLVVPGAGHHAAGRALVGFALTFFLCLGIMLVLVPNGVIRPVHELFSDNWGGPKTLGYLLALSSGLTLLLSAVRGIDPLQSGRS